MDKSNHAQYLASEWWLNRRKEYLAKNTECAECWIPRWLASIAYGQDLHVHHLNYQNLGAEADDDLQALCRRCHDIEHIGRSDWKAPRTATCEQCGEKQYNIFVNTCDSCNSVLVYQQMRENPTERTVYFDFEQAFQTLRAFFKGTPPKEVVLALEPIADWLIQFYAEYEKRVENDEIPF